MDFAEAIVKAKNELKNLEHAEMNKNYPAALDSVDMLISYLYVAQTDIENRIVK
jgi:hypothetical protein